MIWVGIGALLSMIAAMILRAAFYNRVSKTRRGYFSFAM
jgi:hypothetical protein